MTPIAQIKAALRFDEYAARYLDIKNGNALCLVHQEKTPSLVIHEQYAKCFGCGWNCDLISFAAAFHGISTGQAVRMLAHELGIPLTRQPTPHPYDAAKEARTRAEAEEWARQCRLSLVDASHQCCSAHFDQVDPFRRILEAMPRHRILAAYREQRTIEQAALLRASIRESDLWVKAMTPLAGALIDRLASAPESEFPDCRYGERKWQL